MPIVDFELVLVHAGTNIYDLVSIVDGSVVCPFDSNAVRLTSTNFPAPGGVQIRPYIIKGNNMLVLSTGESPWLTAYELGADDYSSLPEPYPTAICYNYTMSPYQYESVVGFNDNATGILFIGGVPPSGFEYPGAASVHLAYSPDDKWLAAVHVISPYLTVYDRINNMAKVVFSGLLSQVAPSAAQWTCAFSPDSAWFATCGDAANSFCLYDTATWNQVALTAPNIKIFDVKFSPDGTKVGIVSGELGRDSPNALGYYDIALGTFVWAEFNFGSIETYWGPPGIFMLHWLDNTTTVFVGMRNKNPSQSTNIMIWDWTANYLTVLPTGLGDCWGGAVVSAMSSRIVSGTVKDDADLPLDRSILIVDRNTGKFLGETYSFGGVFSAKIPSRDSVFVIVKGEGGELSELYDSRPMPQDAAIPVPFMRP